MSIGKRRDGDLYWGFFFVSLMRRSHVFFPSRILSCYIPTLVQNIPTLHGRIPRSCRPQWTTTIPLLYELGSDCYFRVRVFRVCQKGEDQSENLGSGVFEVGDILGSMNRTKIRRLPKGGV